MKRKRKWPDRASLKTLIDRSHVGYKLDRLLFLSAYPRATSPADLIIRTRMRNLLRTRFRHHAYKLKSRWRGAAFSFEAVWEGMLMARVNYQMPESYRRGGHIMRLVDLILEQRRIETGSRTSDTDPMRVFINRFEPLPNLQMPQVRQTAEKTLWRMLQNYVGDSLK